MNLFIVTTFVLLWLAGFSEGLTCEGRTDCTISEICVCTKGKLKKTKITRTIGGSREVEYVDDCRKEEKDKLSCQESCECRNGELQSKIISTRKEGFTAKSTGYVAGCVEESARCLLNKPCTAPDTPFYHDEETKCVKDLKSKSWCKKRVDKGKCDRYWMQDDCCKSCEPVLEAQTTIAPSAPGQPSLYDQQCLNDANQYRRYHPGTPDLMWDYDLTVKAQSWADKLASMPRPKSDADIPHDTWCNNVWQTGENIYWRSQSWGDKALRCKQANKEWYDEIEHWNFDTNRGKGTGHFTQMVWVKAAKVGYGFAHAKGYGSVIVAKYAPAGNVQGGAASNVLPPAPGCLHKGGCGRKDAENNIWEDEMNLEEDTYTVWKK